MTVLPQQYTLHAIKTGATEQHRRSSTWYYESATDSTSLNSSCIGQSGYNFTIGNGTLLHSNNNSYDYTLTVTWNGENITSGVLSQSNNNGDHVYRFNLNVGTSQHFPVNRNRTLTVTGK